MQLPEEDRYYATKTDMENEIIYLLGGRVSEALFLDDISTGASNDLERVTKIAHDMVVKYGMSEAIGPINYSVAEEVFLGRDFTSKQNYSEALASRIDEEVKRIIEEAYKKTEDILKTHSEELERVANALLEMETLDDEEFEAIFTNSQTVEDLQRGDRERAAARKRVEAAEAKTRARREAEERRTEEEQNPYVRVAVMDKDGNFRIKNNEASDADGRYGYSESETDNNLDGNENE